MSFLSTGSSEDDQLSQRNAATCQPATASTPSGPRNIAAATHTFVPHARNRVSPKRRRRRRIPS
jgi:hypothetical protein